MNKKQKPEVEGKVIYTDPKTGKKELISDDIVAKLNKIKDQLSSRKITADVWYDLDKHSYEWEESDGHFRSYNGENFMQVKDIPISVLPHVDTDLKAELSDEYKHDHLQDAVCYNWIKKEFVKADSGKLKWSLMPFEELKDVVKVLMHGAEKYSPDNWKKCDDVTRYEDALLRHVIAYISGDKIDREFGLSHLAHAVCNCLFLMWFDNNKEDKKSRHWVCLSV